MLHVLCLLSQKCHKACCDGVPVCGANGKAKVFLLASVQGVVPAGVGKEFRDGERVDETGWRWVTMGKGRWIKPGRGARLLVPVHIVSYPPSLA